MSCLHKIFGADVDCLLCLSSQSKVKRTTAHAGLSLNELSSLITLNFNRQALAATLSRGIKIVAPRETEVRKLVKLNSSKTQSVCQTTKISTQYQ